MYNDYYERVIGARGREAASEDDAIARYIAINAINADFARISQSAQATEEVGLGSNAEAALVALPARLERLIGDDFSNPQSTEVVLSVVPVERLSQALSLVRLPDGDDNLLARINRQKNGHDLYTPAEKREIAKGLQALTITVLPHRLVLRNKLPGLEAECPLPARAAGNVLPEGGVSFVIKFYKLHTLFKPSDATVPKSIRRQHQSEKKELLLLLLNPVTSRLKVIYAGTVLDFAVDMAPIPEPLLADLGSRGDDATFPALLFSKAFSVINYLGGSESDVQVQNGRMSMHGLNALRVTATGFDEHDLAIPLELVAPLRKLFSWIRDGASIRRSGGHYIVSKQNYIVVFATGRTSDVDADDHFARFKGAAFHVQLDPISFMDQSFQPDCLANNNEKINGKTIPLDGAALKLFAGEAQAAAICATRTGLQGNIDKSISYVNATHKSSNTEYDTALEIDPRLWTRLIQACAAKRVELYYDPGVRFPLLELHASEIMFEIVLYTLPLEHENLKTFVDETCSSPGWDTPKFEFEMNMDEEEFASMLNKPATEAPSFGQTRLAQQEVERNIETFGWLVGSTAVESQLPDMGDHKTDEAGDIIGSPTSDDPERRTSGEDADEGMPTVVGANGDPTSQSATEVLPVTLDGDEAPALAWTSEGTCCAPEEAPTGRKLTAATDDHVTDEVIDADGAPTSGSPENSGTGDEDGDGTAIIIAAVSGGASALPQTHVEAAADTSDLAAAPSATLSREVPRS